MNENSELRVFVPFRGFVILQRLPIRSVRPFMIPVIDFFQKCRARCVIFSAGLLPEFINLVRPLGDGRSCWALGLHCGRCKQDENNGTELSNSRQGFKRTAHDFLSETLEQTTSGSGMKRLSRNITRSDFSWPAAAIGCAAPGLTHANWRTLIDNFSDVNKFAFRGFDWWF